MKYKIFYPLLLLLFIFSSFPHNFEAHMIAVSEEDASFTEQLIERLPAPVKAVVYAVYFVVPWLFGKKNSHS